MDFQKCSLLGEPANVVAAKGNLFAKDIAIIKVQQLRNSETHTKFKQSGLSVSLSTPAISLLETASSLADAAGKTSDGRMQALAAGAAALNVYNNKEALQSLANGEAPKAEVSVAITVGSSKSQSDSMQSSSTAKASQLQAGGNVNLIATGAGENSNILLQGSDILAGNNASLIAENQVNLLAATNTSRDRSSNSSSSAAVGVAIKIGQGGLEAGITASASKGRGHANSDDLLHDNSHVTAGKQLILQSGGTTNMQGAVVSADKVIANIGGDFNLESLQDTSTYQAKQQSLGGSVTFGAGISGSASYSNSRAKGDYTSVTEQTGIQAGGGGFDIHVKGNTDLKGAVIASSQAAIDANLNRLSTGTLTHSDVENHSDHEASAVNLSGGFSVGGKAQDKTASNSDTVGKGTDWSWQNQGKSGVKSAAAGISSDSGSESSSTRSSISQAQITITDETGQQAITGQSAFEAIASIDREVLAGDNANGLTKAWDGQQLMQEQAANAEIMAAFGQQAGQAIGTSFQAKADELRDQADTKQGEEKQALLNEAKKWDEGGIYRVAAHTATGGLSGGITGALGAAGAASAAPLLNELQNNIAQNLKDAGASADVAKLVGQMVTGATATGLGAAVGGPAGAAVALNVDVNNRQLHATEIQHIKGLAKGDAEKEARLTAAACALVKCYAEHPEDSPAYNQLKAMADAGASVEFAAEREQLQQQQGLFIYSTKGLKSDENRDAVKRFDNTYQVTTRTLGAGQAALGVAGVIGAATTAPVSCATGIGCVANTFVATMGADVAYTGAKQAISGQSEATMVSQALQGLGMSEEAAGYAEFAFGVGAAAKVGNVINAATNHAAKLNNLARASQSRFLPSGIEATPEVLKIPQVQAMFNELKMGAPTLSDDNLYRYVRQWLQSGSTLPSAAIAAPGSRLIKIVPKGEGVTTHSPYWMSVEQARTIATMTPEQAGKALGLPAEQAWKMLNGGVDFYAITPKIGVKPKVFVSDVAETMQGKMNNLSDAKQVIVPNRSLWTEPMPINPMALR